MTRRRIIAGVILLAALVAAVPLVPGVWRALVYRVIRTAPVEGDKSGQPVLFLLEKRWSWLPVDSTVIPDQLCRRCRLEHHNSCWSTPASRNHDLTKDDPGDPWAAFRCTCTDPSHDGDSE